MLLFLMTALIAVRARYPKTIVFFALISQGTALLPASISPIERYSYCIWMIIASICVGVFIFWYINIYLAKNNNVAAERVRRSFTIILIVLICLSTSAMFVSGYAGVLSGRGIVNQTRQVEAGETTIAPMRWTLLGEALQKDNTAYNAAQSFVVYIMYAPEVDFDPNMVSGLFEGVPAAFHKRLFHADSANEARALKAQISLVVIAEDRMKSSGASGLWARAAVRVGDL